MLVTHLILETEMSVEAAVYLLSILCLPQAIDCAGGLVSVHGLCCLVGYC